MKTQSCLNTGLSNWTKKKIIWGRKKKKDSLGRPTWKQSDEEQPADKTEKTTFNKAKETTQLQGPEIQVRKLHHGGQNGPVF